MQFDLRVDPFAQEAEQGDEDGARPAIEGGLVHLVQGEVNEAGDETGHHHAAGQATHQAADGAIASRCQQRAEMAVSKKTGAV